MLCDDSLDYDDLKIEYETRRAEELQEKIEKRKGKLTGLAGVLNSLKSDDPSKPRERLALGAHGEVLSVSANGVKNTNKVSTHAPHGAITIMPLNLGDGIARYRNPAEIRRLVRSKMIRCKRCRNRFLEKHIYERHLRDNHPVDHLAYLLQQEEEMQAMRAEEIEANRIEEITSGGFIPPQDDMDARKYIIDPSSIPLPGELTNGVTPRYDKFGVLHQPKRVYKKKVSPQCPFCDKRFRNEHSLKKHIEKKHEDCTEFAQCLDCFKCVPTKEDLPNHHCDMKFLTPRKLRKHKKMSHVFTKTYPCHFCDELFTSETGVTTHERIHTGIIKFECKICDYKCNRFNVMEGHRKEEHGYVCAVCNEKQSEWADIKNHTLTTHGGYLSMNNTSDYILSPRVWVMYKGE
ncbi:hypothetical protein FO519_005743 [Halicephalobus sp. NKZ332]|nr:hypothetical protein FO519_005743 [Halicephalobus sp. NKZ332]